MQDSIPKQAFDAYQYNVSHAKQISAACHPLFKNFGLTHFWYSRMLDDGTILECSNDIAWKKMFWEENAGYEWSTLVGYARSNLVNNNTFHILWPPILSNKLICMTHSYGLSCLYNIFIQRDKYIESYGFATASDNFEILNLYRKHPDILVKFGDYFKEKTESIIQNFPLVSFIEEAPQSYKFSYEREVDQFLKDINADRYVLKTNAKKVPLTTREAEVLLHLSLGKTSKEIACSLGLSPRTVDSYLDTIKAKTACTSRSQLVGCFHKSNLYGCTGLEAV